MPDGPSVSGRLAGRSAEFVILGLVAAAVGAGVWMMASTFVPLSDGEEVEYVFLAAPLKTFVVWALGVWGVLSAVHVKTQTRSDVPQRSGNALDRVSYAAPLALFALLLLPLLILWDAASRPLIVLSYFLVDLRGWLVVAVTAFFFLALARRAGWASGLGARRLPVWMAYVSLAAAAVTFGLASSPPYRFESARIVGDEPKYIRYMETFYQGHGFDVSHNRPFDEFGRGSADRFGQLLSLGGGVAQAIRGVTADAVRWVRGTGGFSNKGRYLEGATLEGKDGGTYQLHMPGLSLLLYPFYYLDRHYLNDRAGYHDEFPQTLTFTNAAILGLYTLWGLVIFQLLVRYTTNRTLSWCLALTVLVTMPVAAFNFQYYPEVTGGIVTFLLCGAVLFGFSGSRRHAFLYGVLAGFLPWLHVRYLGLSVICAGGFLLACRHVGRTAAAFAAGFALCLMFLGLYFHHITGSVLPTAMYAAMPSTRFYLGGIALALRDTPFALTGFLLDRMYGILPYSPVYFLAFFGLRPFLVDRRREAMFICLVAGSLVFLAGFDQWTGGSSTPSRLIIAVTPLAAFPLAHAFRRFGASRQFMIVAALLWVISVDNAIAYNSNLQRFNLAMSDDSFSGWKTTLLFPSILRFGREQDAPLRTAFWLGSTIVLALGAWRLAKRSSSQRQAPFAPWRSCAALGGVILVGGVSAGALTRWPEGFRPELMMQPEEAKQAALTYYVRYGCALCVSSRLGLVQEQDVPRRLLSYDFSFDDRSLRRRVQVGKIVRRGNRRVLHFSPRRHPAGEALQWRLPTLPPGPAVLELHARTARADPSVVLSVTVFNRGSRRVVAHREIRGDEVASADYVVVPVPFAVDPDQDDLSALLDYEQTAEAWVDRFIIVASRSPSDVVR